MLVEGVSGVTYNELGQIELSGGEVRRCKVLEVDGDKALVQLFESAAGINLAESKVRFLGKSMTLGASGDMLGRVFDGMGTPIDGRAGNYSGGADRHQRRAHEPGGQGLSFRVHTDRRFSH